MKLRYDKCIFSTLTLHLGESVSVTRSYALPIFRRMQEPLRAVVSIACKHPLK